MKHPYLFIGVLGLALFGCERKEPQEFNSGDEEIQEGDGAEAIHFGPNPGDGLMEEAEEGLHFGTSPGDG